MTRARYRGADVMGRRGAREHLALANGGLVPPDIGPLSQWTRADQALAFSGSNVTFWGDLTANGHDWSQGTASRQPFTGLYAFPNGVPSVRFLAQDILEAPTGPDLAVGQGSWLQAMVLRRETNPGSRQTQYALRNQSVFDNISLTFESGNQARIFWGSPGGAQGYAASTATLGAGPDAIVVAGVDSDTSESLYAIATSAVFVIQRQAITLSGTGLATNPLALHGGSGGAGVDAPVDYGEVLFYNFGAGAPVPDAAVTAVIDYLAQFWELW
jgi:hypothetical protein